MVNDTAAYSFIKKSAQLLLSFSTVKRYWSLLVTRASWPEKKSHFKTGEGSLGRRVNINGSQSSIPPTPHVKKCIFVLVRVFVSHAHTRIGCCRKNLKIVIWLQSSIIMIEDCIRHNCGSPETVAFLTPSEIDEECIHLIDKRWSSCMLPFSRYSIALFYE